MSAVSASRANIAGAEFVAQFGEHLADLVIDGPWPLGRLAEPGKEGEQLLVNEGDEVFTDHGAVVVECAVGLWCGPLIPAVLTIDDGGVCLAIEFSAVAAFGFQIVQVFQEQNP